MAEINPNEIREIKIEGFIGETSDFFLLPTKGFKEFHLDLEKATYMNSVGVKHWISWTLKLPSTLKVILKKCPNMIANQASMVMGFLPPNFEIESFFAPYICSVCETEYSILFKAGENYQRDTEASSGWVKLPEVKCTKCAGQPELEPDFFPEKTFGFLKSKK